MAAAKSGILLWTKTEKLKLSLGFNFALLSLSGIKKKSHIPEEEMKREKNFFYFYSFGWQKSFGIRAAKSCLLRATEEWAQFCQTTEGVKL